jgi:hypothetical protein
MVLDFSFRLGVFSKNFWAYRFVFLAIISAVSGIQSYSKYSRGLLGSSKSTCMPGLPVNGKCSHHGGPGFEPGSGYVGFVVDKVVLGQVFSEYYGFPCPS